MDESTPSANVLEPARSQAAHRLVERPWLYVVVLVVAFVVAFGYKLRVHGVFACPPTDRTGSHYLAYCNATAFGDYDRGAFRFELEPDAVRSAALADVLFLGSSRMQFALSSQATATWFERNRASHYLLGFSHTENVVFNRPLLEQLQPRARAYVINVDRFFHDRVTPPTAVVLHDRDARSTYREKRFWQSLHGPLCSAVPLACGEALTFVRFRESGHWELRGSTRGLPITPVGDGPALDRANWPRYAQIAEDFIARLPVRRECIVLTIVPSQDTMLEEAQSISDALSLPLLAPRPDGLRTFDASHLDRASAELWSRAFFEAAGSRLTDCIGRTAS